MNASTPVRNHNVNGEFNVSESRDNNDSEIILSDSPSFQDRLSLEEQSDLLLSQNNDQFTGKTQRVLPFSPIACDTDVPSTLLPLLDTPDFRWSSSILSNNHFQTQPDHSPDLCLEENFISSPGEQLIVGDENADYTLISNRDIIHEKKSPICKTNIVQSTPIIPLSPVLTRYKRKKISSTVNKNLFPTPPSTDRLKEQKSTIIINSFSIGDDTLNALYSNDSTYVEANHIDEQSFNFSLNSTFDLVDEKVDTKILEKRHKKPFLYPVETVSKCIVRVDDIYESVLPLENTARLPVRSPARRPFPKGMVSFSQLSQLPNESNVEEEFTFPISQLDDVTRNAELSLPSNACSKKESWWRTFPTRFCRIISNDRDLYAHLKTYFEYYRVDFAKMVFETKRRSIRHDYGNAINLSQWCQLPYLWNTTINVCLNARLQTSHLTFAFVGEFFDFFRLYFHLVYNFNISRYRIALPITVDDRFKFKKRKRATLLSDEIERIEEPSQMIIKNCHNSPERKLLRTSHSELANDVRIELIDENSIVELLFEDFDITTESSKAEESILTTKSNTYTNSTANGEDIATKERSVIKAIYNEPPQTSPSIQQSKMMKANPLNIKNGLVRFNSAEKKSSRVDQKLLQRAKNLSDDLTDLESNKSELYRKAFEQTKSPTKVVIEMKSVVDKPKLNGFSTAAGKSISVDEESIAQAEKLLRDITADEFLDLNSPESKKDRFSLQRIGSDVLQLGFSTAAGNSIEIKEEALTKAKQMMNDVVNEYDTDLARPTQDFDTLDDGNLKHLRDSSKTEIFSPSMNIGFPGFSSASGKSIKINEKFLMKAQKMMKDAANEEYADFECIRHLTTVPVDDVQRATSSDSGTPLSDFTNARGCAYGGFSSAGGKSIKINEKPLIKAQEMLNDVANENYADFVRAERVLTTVADDNVQRVTTSDSSSSLRDSTNIRGYTFGGFNTAGGKSIQIDEKSMMKAKIMMESAANEQHIDLVHSKGVRKATDGTLNNSECDSYKTDSSISTVASLAGTKYPAFSTAGGKSIKIDEKSLTRAANLFDEVVNENISTGENSTVETRFNASVKVESNLKYTESIPNVGFSTAGGKSIVIDNKLVSQARKKFEDLPDDWLPTKSSRLNSSFLIHGVKNAGRNDKIEKLDVPCSSGSNTVAEQSIKADEKLELENVVDGWLPHSRSHVLQLQEKEISDQNEDVGTIARKKLLFDIEKLKKAEKFFESATHEDDEEQKEKLSASNANFTRAHSLGSSVLLEDTNAGEKRYETEFEAVDPSNAFNIAHEISESAMAIFSNLSDSSDTLAPTTSSLSEMQIQRSKASSPIFDSNKGSRKRRYKQKRRNQCSLSLTPLDVTYVRKEGEGGEKSSTESVLRIFNNSFAQKCGKRKDTASNLSYPALKKVKESDRTVIAANRRKAAVEQQYYVENKDKENRRQRMGSYMTAKMNGGRKSLVEVVDGRPRMYSIEKLLQLGVKRSVINVNAKNAPEFVFTSDFLHRDHLNEVGMIYGDECVVIPNENNEVGIEQLLTAFLASPGVDPRLISIPWIRNHYRWIVWKLASVEKSFPTIFGGCYLTIDRVLIQLKFRYDWEIDKCKRSALKKILECDDSASKAMILCVADIVLVEKNMNEYQMELTDGWYGVVCNCDTEMSKLIVKKKISVGTKLLITNADLSGVKEGYDPLELPEEVRLKISTNSVRRARWNAILGFYYGPSIRVKELKNILPNGGVIPPLTATIARIYPFLYMEKKPDGCSELYNEKVRTKRLLEWESRRQSFFERTISQVTIEVQKELGVNALSDSDEMRNESDQIAVQNCRYEEQEKMRRLIEEKVNQKLPDELKHQNCIRRLVKVRLTNVDDENAESSAVLTIWSASDDCMSLLLENKAYEFYNLVVSGCRHGELQLSNSRMTRYGKTTLLPTVVRYQRRFTPVGDLKPDFVSPFGEIDTVGVVIDYENVANESNTANEIVYLADLEQNILAVTFKSNSKGNGFEEVLKPKRIIAGVDLQWKGGSLHWKIPVVFACDYSYFSHMPRYKYLHAHLNEFETYFKNNSIDEFVEICKKKIEDSAMVRDGPAATSTPVKICSRSETSGNVSANTSAAASNVSLQTNKSRDSSYNTTSRNALSRMEQLRRYGEPPPLSPICLNARPKRAKLSVQTRIFKTNNVNRT